MAQYITYTQHESGIHEIKWLDHKRDAIKEFVEITNDILKAFPADSTALILQDFRDSSVPSFMMLMDAMRKSGTRKDVKLRIAYIADDSSLQLIINSLTISHRISGNREFFKAHQQQDAIDWLLSN